MTQWSRKQIENLPSEESRRLRWLILVAACLSTGAKMLQPPLWIFNPPGVELFDASWNSFRMVASLGGVLLLVFLLVGGFLGDLYGRRRVWLIGLAGMIASNLLIILSPAPAWQFFLRFCALASGSLFVPLALATLNITFLERSRPIAFAIYTIVVAGSIQLAWLQGQFLLSWIGWRATYILPLVVAVIAVIWVYRIVPETQVRQQRQFDVLIYSGWTLLILATFYGLTMTPVASERWKLVAGAAILVGLLGVLLVLWQNRSWHARNLRMPSISLRDMVVLVVTGAVIQFLLVGYSLRLIGLFQVVRSATAVKAVIALAPLFLGLLVALYFVVKAVRPFRARTIIAGGMLTMGAALSLTALLPIDASYLLLALTMVIFGAGYLVAGTIWTSAFLRTAITAHHGVNAAINNATTSIGGAIGSALTGNLLAILGLKLYSQQLIAANASLGDTVGSLSGFTTLILSEPVDVAAVAEYTQFDLLAGYREAYALATNQVMWLMAAFGIMTAVIVALGLRGSLKAIIVDFINAEEQHATQPLQRDTKIGKHIDKA